MRSEWRIMALSDVLEKVIDYRGKTPKKMGGEWTDTGYRVLSAKHIKTGRIVKEAEIRTVSQEVYDKWMQIEVKRGDIILTSEAPFGEALFWNSDEMIVLGQRLYGLRAAPAVINSKFLYYTIVAYDFQQQLSARATGTTVRGLRQPELLKCTVPVPSLATQMAIADTLSCLDAKIELNNKINENLEVQAETIYKSWFMDFDPFQDGEFVESELGLIPKGWQVEKLSTVVDVKYGKDHKPLADGDIPVYGSGGIMRYVDTALYEKETVLIPRKGTLGNVMLVNHPFWSVDTMFFTELKIPHFSKFLYHMLLNKDLAAMNVGSAVPSMTVALLNDIKFALPPATILEKFEEVIGEFYDLIQAHEKQNNVLSSLRDTLLPKLMSGEIEVPVE